MKFVIHSCLIIFGLLCFGCKKDENPITIDTEKPTVVIISPADNSNYLQHGGFSIVADASDNVGVVKVEVYFDGSLIKSFTKPPYQLSWNGNQGSHTIYAKAYDVAENVGQSNVVKVTINL